MAVADDSTIAGEEFRKILIPMIRKVIPGMIASEIVGVQPMTGPSGLVYSMKPRYGGSGKRADKADSFDDWLKDNSFANNRSNVDRYIKELENPDAVFL